MAGNRAFGDFLRSRRTRLSCEPCGDASRRRRRTPGLKREEVAQRADISVEWYVKLEQGRANAPSAETVEALGRALSLDQIELAHLHALATAATRQPFQREQVSQPLRRIIARLPQPAYITGQRWDVLAWNDSALELFADFGPLALEDRNILHWMFTAPVAKGMFGQAWTDEARRMVSLFRVTHDLWAGDAAFADLVGRIRAKSPEFDVCWSEHSVAAPVSGSKQLQHPTLGLVRYGYASFQANDDPALKLALYTRL